MVKLFSRWHLLAWTLAFSVSLCVTGISVAQDSPELSAEQIAMIEKLKSIQWQSGPNAATIGSIATIQVPEGYDFVGAQGAQTLLEIYGNPRDPSILAAIVPTSEDQDWTLIFKFDDIGYVKDQDKDSLDAVSILSNFNASLPYQNEQRRAMGAEEISRMSWTEQPFFDDETKNLTWALCLHFPSGDSINYDIRMLGRSGVMEATLLGDPESYRAAVPDVKKVLKGFAFNAGSTYADWRPGDSVAELGLAGLVAGGAAVVAAKTGLFAKLGLILAKSGKAIVVAILVFGAGIWSILKKIVGARSSSSTPE